MKIFNSQEKSKKINNNRIVENRLLCKRGHLDFQMTPYVAGYKLTIKVTLFTSLLILHIPCKLVIIRIVLYSLLF
jgi:hypothetical protein